MSPKLTSAVTSVLLKNGHLQLPAGAQGLRGGGVNELGQLAVPGRSAAAVGRWHSSATLSFGAQPVS